MKFILSLTALVLFFAFALAEVAKTITYPDAASGIELTPTEPTPVAGLHIVSIPRQEKAGFSF